MNLGILPFFVVCLCYFKNHNISTLHLYTSKSYLSVLLVSHSRLGKGQGRARWYGHGQGIGRVRAGTVRCQWYEPEIRTSYTILTLPYLFAHTTLTLAHTCPHPHLHSTSLTLMTHPMDKTMS